MQQSTTFDEESSLLIAETSQQEQQQQPRKLNVLAVTASILATGLLAAGAYTTVNFTSAATGSTELTRLSSWEYTKSTNKNSDGDLRYIDRHSMVCDGADAMVGFKVTDKLKFTYNCAKIPGAALQRQDEFYTGSVGANGLNWLDRINTADCKAKYGDNSYMNAISGSTDNGNFRWRIGCSMYSQKWQYCENKYTNYEDYGNAWENIYLDRQNVMCPSGSLMQAFKAETADISCGWWGMSKCNRLRFRMTCCWADAHDPTPSPISRPTSKPIANPTEKPVASPTHAPTKEPIAEPTKEPVATPTEQPISEPTFAPNVAAEVKIEAEILEDATKDQKDAQVVVAEGEKKLEDIQSDLKEADAKEHDAEKVVNDLQDSLNAHEQELADAKSDSGGNPHRVDDAEDAVQKNIEEIKEAKEDLEEANKLVTGLISDREGVYEDVSEAQKELIENINIVDNIKEIVEERMKELVCPFTFKQGVSKVEVPSGCVFFASNDVTYSTQKKMDAPALYICGMDSSPIILSEADFKKYNLEGTVSYIQPGDDTKVVFSSNEEMKSEVATFTSKTYKPLNSFKYKGGASANDRVKVAHIISSTDSIPDNCDDLHFSKKMNLNVAMMATKRREVSPKEKKMLLDIKKHTVKANKI